jgi:hypothetical protein
VVSVVIVTRGRASLLERCVRSLIAAAAAAPERPVELVVEVNGRDAASSAALSSLAEEARAHGIELRHHEEQAALSPAGARNRVLREARGPWIFFADDDIFVPLSIFRDFDRLLERFPGAIALGGPNLTPPGSTIFQRASGLALASRLATWQSVPRYRAIGAPRPCGQESLILCGLFVRTDALGNDPFRDSLACGEENWLIRRLSLGERGRGAVIYSPELLVWHERRRSLAAFARQVFWYGCGRGQNLRLALGERKLEGRRYLVPSACVIYALAALLYSAGDRDLPRAFGLPFLFYGAICAAALLASLAARQDDRPARALSTLLIPVVHCFYGIGVLFGLARRS